MQNASFVPPPISFSRKTCPSGYVPAPAKAKAPPTQQELCSRGSRQCTTQQPEHARRNLNSASDLSGASTPHLKKELGPLPLNGVLGPFSATDFSSGEQSVQIDLDRACLPCPWKDVKAETDWRARRWAPSQTNPTTCCGPLPSSQAEAPSRARVFRQMWRVCVYCDALFTTNSHGAEGVEATVRLAKEYPRACVAPGTCDDCLEDIVEVRSVPNRAIGTKKSRNRDLRERPKALSRPGCDKRGLDQKGFPAQ